MTYEVRGPLRDVVLCHCTECRRWGGTGAGAFSSARVEHLVVDDGPSLRWVDSPESARSARRGFCSECGSSLFWHAKDAERIGIAAGTLDDPTGLRPAAHIYTHQAIDWEVLPDDGLPRDADLGSLDIRWS